MTDKLELKSSHEVVYTVNVADVESIFYCKPTDPDILTVLMKDGKRLYCDEVCPVQEEPVSESLEAFIKERVKNIPLVLRSGFHQLCRQLIRDGAEWKKEQMMEKAVETTFNVSLPSGLYDKLWIKGCKEGDKLLVIKKDEL